MRPTARRLYERMRAWFADAIEDGHRARRAEGGGDPGLIADRVLALADGYGVRVLFGDLEVEQARRGDLGGARAPTSGCPSSRPRPLTRRIPAASS